MAFSGQVSLLQVDMVVRWFRQMLIARLAREETVTQGLRQTAQIISGALIGFWEEKAASDAYLCLTCHY